jgi:outer membrane lipopolysaccharide assembly protein LptE/RlpB
MRVQSAIFDFGFKVGFCPISRFFQFCHKSQLSYGFVRKLIILGCLLLSGCGYRLAGSQLNEGVGRSIAVPTFTNRTTTYRVEQQLTEEVRRELIRRTHFKVTPENTGDVVVTGEVLNYNAVPVIFDPNGRGSAYTILVDLSVRIIDTQTGKDLFRNDRMTFREVFELAQNSNEFVPEDPAAVERLARHFASTLVASLLHSK